MDEVIEDVANELIREEVGTLPSHGPRLPGCPSLVYLARSVRLRISVTHRQVSGCCAIFHIGAHRSVTRSANASVESMKKALLFVSPRVKEYPIHPRARA